MIKDLWFLILKYMKPACIENIFPPKTVQLQIFSRARLWSQGSKFSSKTKI